MTPEEKQQVSAMRDSYELSAKIAIRQAADTAIALEEVAQRLKTALARIKELEPKAEPKLEVVP